MYRHAVEVILWAWTALMRRAFEQRQRLEDEMARTAGPGDLEREHQATVGQQPESVLSDRGTEQNSGRAARAVRRRHLDVGVEIEAREVRASGERARAATARRDRPLACPDSERC